MKLLGNSPLINIESDSQGPIIHSYNGLSTIKNVKGRWLEWKCWSYASGTLYFPNWTSAPGLAETKRQYWTLQCAGWQKRCPRPTRRPRRHLWMPAINLNNLCSLSGLYCFLAFIEIQKCSTQGLLLVKEVVSTSCSSTALGFQHSPCVWFYIILQPFGGKKDKPCPQPVSDGESVA